MTRPAAPSATMGVVTVVLTLIGWASVPLFLRHFAHLIDFWTSNGWRYGFSALVWAPVLVFAAMMVRGGLPRGLWKAALIPSIVNAAGQICFAWAHYRIEPGLVTFSLRTQLIFVAIGAYFMFPAERAVIRTRSYLVGAAILLLGMTAVVLLAEIDDAPTPATAVGSAIIAEEAARPFAGGVTDTAPIRDTGLAPPSRAAYIQGVGLALLSGLLFAGYGLSVRKYMHGVNSVLAFAAICQYTALAMVVLMFIFGNHAGADVLALPGDQIVLLLFSAIIGIAIGHVFYYFSIARLGVAVTAGVLQLQPFLVAVASFFIFNEVLNLWQWTGGTIAVGGAMLMLGVQWRLSRRRPALETPVQIVEGESGS